MLFRSIEYQSAFIFGSSNDNNTVRKDKYGSYRVIGLEPQFNKIAPAKILKGRFLNELDIKEARKVCVVGTRVVNDLYGEEEDPIGTMLRINNIYYMVVGVAEAYSSNVNIFGNVEEQVNIPISTLQRSMNKGNKIDGLAVTAYEDIDIDGLEADIKQFLMRRHHVSPDDEDAIQSFSFKMILSSIQMLFVGLNALIWIVGLGTLLAGLIGVSNIMLVTVRERTQEIGIRRALGATPRVILTQVLSESVVLTTLSGVVGITVGAGVLALVGSVMGDGGSDSMMQDPQISFGVAIGALVILIVSGLFAGMLPTKRALQIKPIEALRDE